MVGEGQLFQWLSRLWGDIVVESDPSSSSVLGWPNQTEFNTVLVLQLISMCFPHGKWMRVTRFVLLPVMLFPYLFSYCSNSLLLDRQWKVASKAPFVYGLLKISYICLCTSLFLVRLIYHCLTSGCFNQFDYFSISLSPFLFLMQMCTILGAFYLIQVSSLQAV